MYLLRQIDTKKKIKSYLCHWSICIGGAKNIILGGELQKGIPSGSDQGSPLLTPDQKLGRHKSSRQAASPSCGCCSSDFSMKEGTALSSSSSSSDSESISFNSSNYSGIPITIEGDGFTVFPSLKKKNREAEDDNADSLLEGRENGRYEELLGGIIEYEEKLRVSNLRLQLSEEEATRLKSELHTQIESAQRDMKMREADLESERRQVFQLQNQITELETHVSESDFEIERLLKELALTRERLKGSDEEIERLKNELANEISVGTHLVQGQLKLSWEDVAMLNAELDLARRKIFESQERIAKLKHDMLMAEKDEITAKVNTIMAEASSRDDRIRQMEDQMRRLHVDHTKLISVSETAQKLVDELRVRVTMMTVCIQSSWLPKLSSHLVSI